MPTVITDYDGIITINKEPPYCQVEHHIKLFKRQSGNKLIVITGAPRKHVSPALFLSDTIFSEHGAVRWNKGGEIIVFSADNAIDKLKKELGIIVEDGLQQISGETVIVEGPREGSFTPLFGRPPHYPGVETTANPGMIQAQIEEIIAKRKLPIKVKPGHDGTYTWLDCVLTDKKTTVKSLLNDSLPQPIYYLGDRENDLEVMKLEGIVPVGFLNCIPEIVSFAKERGIYFPEVAYESGVPLFLRSLIKNGKLS